MSREPCASFVAAAIVGASLWPSVSFGQTLVYQEPGHPACAPPQASSIPASTPASARAVRVGSAVAGRLVVPCSFEEGSYTVTLNVSDASAKVTPKTFLVNFGKLSGDGKFTVVFASPGMHTVTATITQNMGSPVLKGSFVSVDNAFTVSAP